jgi:hypothetical protein
MVNVGELLLGLVLFVPAVWAIYNPHRDFAIGKRIDPGFWGVEKTDEIELSETGVLKNQLVYSFVAFAGLYFIGDAFI